MFDSNPILWQCLHIVAEPPSQGRAPPGGLVTCAPICRSLLTVLTQHWQHCCADSTATFSRELHHSTSLVQCMATVSV